MPTGDVLDRETKARRGTAALQILWFPVIAFVVVVLAAWLAKPLVEQVLDSAVVHDFDTRTLAWFRAQATPSLDRVFQGITLLGSAFAMMVFAFLGISVLVNQRRWLLLFAWDVLFLGMWALTQTIKPIFHRARPDGAEQFLYGMSYSFPSTHALGAIAGFGMIAFAVAEAAELEREPRTVLWMFTTVLVVTIGVSRLYLGVHYVSEVVAGFLLGAVWLVVCLFALRRARGNIRMVTNAPSAQS